MKLTTFCGYVMGTNAACCRINCVQPITHLLCYWTNSVLYGYINSTMHIASLIPYNLFHLHSKFEGVLGISLYTDVDIGSLAHISLMFEPGNIQV